MNGWHDGRNWWLLFAGWLAAAAASLVSLFFSEVMGLTPCVLCWYQRAAMFPLVLILAAALFPADPHCIQYALPVAAAGALAALYHSLLFAGIIPAGLQSCTQNVPCTDESARLWGFITIPLLSFTTFAFIIGCLLGVKKDTAA